MGGATIINMVVFVCVPAWGQKAVMLAWVLWWIDAVIAIGVCLYLPWMMCVYFPDFGEDFEFCDVFYETDVHLDFLECVFSFSFSFSFDFGEVVALRGQ